LRDRAASAASAAPRTRRRARLASALLELLDPDAATGDVRGAEAVAEFFAGRAKAALLALVDGVPAAVWSHRGRPKAVVTFTLADEKITRIAIDADPDRLRDLDIVFLGNGGTERR
jgi:hypothetical protein